MTKLKKIPNRYEPTPKKMSGGQGDVYVCRDKNLERDVAIKFIQDIDDLDRLLNEVNILQALRCKHVVEIFDVIRVDAGSGELALVEEYVPGDDVASEIDDVVNKGQQIELKRLLIILYQVSCGLSDIHGAGVVHRDIKLNNMKFDDEDVLKIFDFGLAKEEGPDAETIGFKGTPGFAAPELYAGKVKIEKPVDVYAFGVCAWLLALGKLPKSLLAVPPKMPAKKIANLRPDLPADVADALDMALASVPGERPIMEEIQEILAARLLFDKHRGRLCANNKVWELSATNRTIGISVGSLGEAKIVYDGLDFRLERIRGDIFINNLSVTSKKRLPGASVITFGAPQLAFARRFVTFDISHPEVVI